MTYSRMRAHVRRLTPVVLILAATAACGSARSGPTEPPAVLIFTNESLDQATVYVVAPGVDFRRLGTVIPGRTEMLEVPREFTARGTVNIVARLLARSDLPQTGSVSIRPGERYEVKLQLDGKVISFLPARS